MKPNPTPISTPPSGEYRKSTLPGGKKMWIAIVIIAIAALAIAMPGEIFSGEQRELVGNILYSLNRPDPPPIALNPPNETERKQLADALVEQGYEKEEIGEIEEHYLKDDIPEMIPISESVVIQDLEIVGNDGLRFVVKNVAKVNVSAPFYTIDAQIFVKDPITGKPTALELRRMSWVEIGEEEMEPEEERVIIIENLFDKLDALGYEEYYNISSVKIVYEEFIGWR